MNQPILNYFILYTKIRGVFSIFQTLPWLLKSWQQSNLVFCYPHYHFMVGKSMLCKKHNLKRSLWISYRLWHHHYYYQISITFSHIIFSNLFILLTKANHFALLVYILNLGVVDLTSLQLHMGFKNTIVINNG